MHAMRMQFQFKPGVTARNSNEVLVPTSQPIRVDALRHKTIQILNNDNVGVTLQGSISSIGGGNSEGWVDIVSYTANGIFPIVVPDGLAVPLSSHEPSLNAVRILANEPDEGDAAFPPLLRVFFSGVWYGQDLCQRGDNLWTTRHIPYEGQ